MASRQEEKQRRREERLAREQAEAAAAARRRRIQWAGGGVLALAIVAAIVVLAVAGLGGGSSSKAGEGSQPTASDVSLPKQQIGNLDAAAKAAGCTLQHPPIEGRSHATKHFTAADYKTNPPTSGTHYPQWYQDGVYEPGDTPNLGMLVHTLEHGRIDVQYKPGTPKRTVSQLEGLLSEQSGGYHMLLFQNTTNMRYQVAATAWGQLLGCPTMNPKVFDALRTFRDAYIDKGPERIP
jgi:Protein of unknown function (DUF3105)